MIEKPIRLFAGYDEREKVGFFTFVSSVLRRTKRLVQVTPIAANGLQTGSNVFTSSRFLVPWLCDFAGHAIFLDSSDMLCLGDIADLDGLFDPQYAVQVVRHPDYQSLHERKYIGTEMECSQTNYSRKNWASAMVINCEHPAWRGMTPAGISRHKAIDLLRFRFLEDFEIGDLPEKWNVLVDEGQKSDNPCIIHFSNGIPAFPHYRNTRNSKDWFAEFDDMASMRQG